MVAKIGIVRASGGQNLSYVLSDSGEGMVIDPSSSAEPIWALIEAGRIGLKFIVNTHGHFDHTEGNRRLAERSGAAVAVHELDAKSLRDPPDILLHDGDRLDVGNVQIEVIHTPGHTPGGICLLCEDALFTGDTLFVGNCGRTDLPGGSDADLFQSLLRLKKLPGDIKVYPGHSYWGESSTIDVERRTNPSMMASTLEEFKLVP